MKFNETIKCNKCTYSQEVDQNLHKDQVYCIRYPRSILTGSGFVYLDDACGEFKKKEE